MTTLLPPDPISSHSAPPSTGMSEEHSCELRALENHAEISPCPGYNHNRHKSRCPSIMGANDFICIPCSCDVMKDCNESCRNVMAWRNAIANNDVLYFPANDAITLYCTVRSHVIPAWAAFRHWIYLVHGIPRKPTIPQVGGIRIPPLSPLLPVPGKKPRG